MLEPEQIRAARALFGWSQEKLADASGVSLATVKRIEAEGVTRSSVGTVSAIKEALERAGVVFIAADASGGAGVRLQRKKRKG